MGINPVRAIMGDFTPAMNQTGNSAPMNFGGPIGMLQSAIQQAQRLAQSFSNPQQAVAQYFPDAPAEVRSNPDALVNWMQQTGKVSPKLVQTARQMMGR